jgi:hypothetical protein
MTMGTGFLLRLPIGIIFVAFLAAMIGTWALGRWRGACDRARCDDDARSHASGLHTAMLGLLALLLAFTFSMAAQRFQDNRDMVVLEANAIGTAYLRADIAVEPERAALKDLLRRYVDTRVAVYGAGVDVARRDALIEESERLHRQMWNQAATSAARAPTSTTALLVAAINDVIDFHSRRIDAARNHVPPTILWLLAIMAAASTGLTGYVSGFGNRRHPAPTAIVLVLIALVIVAIIDLDRPRRGFIQGGQESMLELRKSLQPSPPTAL